MIYSVIVFTIVPLILTGYLVGFLRRGKAYGSRWPTRWGQPALYWTNVAAQVCLRMVYVAFMLLLACPDVNRQTPKHSHPFPQSPIRK